MLVPGGVCEACGEKFRPGDLIVRIESVYRVGNVHTEATERGLFAHLRCPDAQE